MRPKGRSPIEAKGIFVTCHSIAPRHFGDAGLVLCGFGAPLSVAEVLTVYMFAHSVTQRGRRSGPTKQTLFGADEANAFLPLNHDKTLTRLGPCNFRKTPVIMHLSNVYCADAAPTRILASKSD